MGIEWARLLHVMSLVSFLQPFCRHSAFITDERVNNGIEPLALYQRQVSPGGDILSRRHMSHEASKEPCFAREYHRMIILVMSHHIAGI